MFVGKRGVLADNIIPAVGSGPNPPVHVLVLFEAERIGKGSKSAAETRIVYFESLAFGYFGYAVCLRRPASIPAQS